MTTPPAIAFAPEAETDLGRVEGTLVVFTDGSGGLGAAARSLDAVMGGALDRAVSDKGFKEKAGRVTAFDWPGGIAARKVLLASFGPEPDAEAARKTGGAIGAKAGKGPLTVATAGAAEPEVLAQAIWAMALRLYDFADYRSGDDEEDGDENGEEKPPREVTVLAEDADGLARLSRPYAALAEGVYFTRDLVNEPANTLSTEEFAARIEAMQTLGLEVEIIEEPKLERMGARALLAVGRGSETPSKIAVMKWMNGSQGEAPLALVGKGVVFDTGGISIKPSAGMEDMTMDMGGAAVVCGVMRTLALRKAKANVVGVVGLVENMPDGRAQRPGDIVRSMKGDTIEVANTDAEGRMVLADCLWFVQETYKPAAIIDLATLTGAVIVALGHHNAGWYATDEALADAFADAARETGDPAWRLPLGKKYAEQNKSRLADVKNTGGRHAGSITAAEFLHRFVKDDMPWIHIDIAGVTLANAATDLAPKGATGWGVAALDRLVRDRFER